MLSAAQAPPPAVSMWWGRRPAGPALSPPPRPSSASCLLGPPPGPRAGRGRLLPRLRPWRACAPRRRGLPVLALITVSASSNPDPGRSRPKPWAAPMIALRAAARGRWPGHRHAPRRRACRWAASPTRTTPTGGRAWSVPRGARTAPTRPPARNNRKATAPSPSGRGSRPLAGGGCAHAAAPERLRTGGRAVSC